jgi:hypothetical protein
MNDMHLDREPLEPLEIPTTTVVMNEIPAFKDLVKGEEELLYTIKSSKVEVPGQLLKLKDFVLNFLKSEHGV